MNRLVDERAAALGGPATFDRPRVVSRRAIPFHVRVRLEDLAESAGIERAAQELRGIVEAMLRHDAQLHARLPRGLDHLARRLERGRDRLLHLHMFLRFGANRQGLQPEVGKRADVDVIHVRMPADFLERRHELAAKLIREGPPAFRVDIRADRQLVANVGVGLRMLMRNRPGADDPYTHTDSLPPTTYLLPPAYCTRPLSVPQIATSNPRFRNTAAFTASASLAASG